MKKCHLLVTSFPFLEPLSELCGRPGPGRLLADGAPVEVGVGHLGEPCQLNLVLRLVVQVGEDGDLPSEVNEVFGKPARPHCRAHLVEEIVAAFGQFKVAK